MDSANYTGIVLAGGNSSRMGRDKGMIAWQGKTLLENAIEILSALCGDILISANNHPFKSFGFRVIEDKFIDCGPMGGILSCLHQSVTDLNLVVPVDVPFITPEIYIHLLEMGEKYDVIVPLDHKSWYQPLCSVFNKSIIKIMEAQISNGILGFTPLIKRVNACEVQFHPGLAGYGEKTFLNINSPSDLKAI